MRQIADRNGWLRVAPMLALVALAAAGPAHAQQSAPRQGAAAASVSQVEARAILMRMARFVAGTQSLSFTVRGGYDTVQRGGQKVEFGETRTIVLTRPDRLRVETERSDGAKILTVFDGKEIALLDRGANVYATTPQAGGLDTAIVHYVRDLGMRLPLAMMLTGRLPAEFEDRVRSVDYVERTNLHGAPAHHLAVRADTVDFQVWIADGDKPLPQRVVITYKTAPGAPQYWASFSDWNLAPAIADATFAADAPAGARRMPFALQLPRSAPNVRKASPGAK